MEAKMKNTSLLFTVCLLMAIFCSSANAGLRVFGFEMGSSVDEVRSGIKAMNARIATEGALENTDAFGITAEGGDFDEDGVYRVDFAFNSKTLTLEHMFISQKMDTMDVVMEILKSKYEIVEQSGRHSAAFLAGDHVVFVKTAYDKVIGEETGRIAYVLKSFLDAKVEEKKRINKQKAEKY